MLISTVTLGCQVGVTRFTREKTNEVQLIPLQIHHPKPEKSVHTFPKGAMQPIQYFQANRIMFILMCSKAADHSR